jgi:hypothetical protein
MVPTCDLVDPRLQNRYQSFTSNLYTPTALHSASPRVFYPHLYLTHKGHSISVPIYRGFSIDMCVVLEKNDMANEIAGFGNLWSEFFFLVYLE